MLGFLFRGLTAGPAHGTALFDALTAEARRPHWYVEGEIPDTLDGRFAVLSTLTALALVRLEADGDAGNRMPVALTERFIEVMESEHRELGIGDPTLGRTVRKLVSLLAKRTQQWRTAADEGWTDATRESLYKVNVSADALDHGGEALKHFANRLEATPLERLEQGKIA